MSVFLAILKWIGIVLGGILGLLLFLVVLLLFVPARYYLQGTNAGDKVNYSYRVSWLFRIVEIRKGKKAQTVRLYLFGIPIRRLSGKEESDTEGNEKTDNQQEKEERAKRKPGQKETSRVPVEEKQKKDFQGKHKKVKKKKAKGQRKEKTKKSFSFERVSSIIRFVRDMENRRAFKKIRKELYMLLRYLSPYRVKGQFIIGTGDPSTTGLLFGGISLLPFAYHDGVHIAPDFEKKVFQAEGYMKGRIRVLYLIRLIIRVYRDRELRMLWKNINQVKEKEAA